MLKAEFDLNGSACARNVCTDLKYDILCIINFV